jgi:acyl-homoserine lactone acylase PvdQ
MIVVGGQCGNPLSPHCRDLLDLWCRGEFAMAPFGRAAVAAAAVSELVLEPARARPAQVSP